MPTSRSRRRRTEPEPPPRRHPYLSLIPLGIVIAAGVLLAALPAAVITHFLPPAVRLEDLSGTIWHGVAARIAVDGRDAGAIEWRLHPLGLLRGAADVDLHWVDLGISVDASATVGVHALRATAVHGGGPIADLAAFGVAPGWRGTAQFDLRNVATDYARIESLDGELRLSNLASPTIAGGAPLGGYVVRFGGADAGERGPAAGGGTLRARVEDSGGPLRLRANVTVDVGARRGMISGTLAARPDAAAAVAAEVAQIAEMRGRDAAGAVPIDLEFTF